MVRRRPSNLGHGHQADVRAGVRVDVIDDSSYSPVANVRILSLRLLTSEGKRYRENIGQMFRFGQFFRLIRSKNRTGQTAV